MNSYVVFDTETTGLDLGTSDIIELAAVKVVDNGVVDTFSTLVITDQDISLDATEVNGLTNEKLEQDGHAPCIVYEGFTNFIGDLPLVAHNGLSFDFILLAKALKKHGFEIPKCPLIADTKGRWNNCPHPYTTLQCRIQLIRTPRMQSRALWITQDPHRRQWVKNTSPGFI